MENRIQVSDTSESVFRDYKDAIKYGQRQVAKQNMLEKVDLNQAFVREDFGSLDYYGVVKDYSTSGSNRNTSVFFKDLEDHLINLIKEAQVVVGCVAWLTSIPILKALSEKKGISFIVQKEDFLRPDSMAMTNWKAQLHQLYDSLPKKLDRRDFYDTILGCMKCEPYALIDPVRCVGNCNIDRQSLFHALITNLHFFVNIQKTVTVKHVVERNTSIAKTMAYLTVNTVTREKVR